MYIVGILLSIVVSSIQISTGMVCLLSGLWGDGRLETILIRNRLTKLNPTLVV